MFSGIKYILGYSNESPDSLKQEEGDAVRATAPEATSTITTYESMKADCNDIMIEYGGEATRPLDQLDLTGDSLANDASIYMDDTWEVIPPPCFTGRSEELQVTTDGVERDDDKSEQSNPKEDARENALIEYPSIYIAETSNKDTIRKTDNNHEASTKLNLAKRIVMKKNAPKKVVRLDIVPQVLTGFGEAAWMSYNESACEELLKNPSTTIEPSALEPKHKQVDMVAEIDEKLEESIELNVDASWSKPAKNEEPAFKMSTIKKKFIGKKILQAKSNAKEAKIPPSGNHLESVEKKAWKNKFIVDDWDLDDQEDVDSDFNNIFEPVKKKKSPIKTKRPRQKNNTHPSVREEKISGGEECLSFDMPIESSIENVSQCLNDQQSSVIELCEDNSESIELISVRSLSMNNSIVIEEENIIGANAINDERGRSTTKGQNKQHPGAKSPKRAVQVRPIEPERRPGWQLKRQRSKRRPLGSATQQLNRQQVSRDKSAKISRSGSKNNSLVSSSSTSSRSSPTFIDRIGNSIVNNITNLTNGLVSSGALNSSSQMNHSPLVERNEKEQQARPKNCVLGLMGTRKQLSKSFLDRQNSSSQQSSRQHRQDRRLKMFTTPNGYSVNRKVHTNIH